jgi:hypothetical protein
MTILRTPDDRFVLDVFPFDPHYIETTDDDLGAFSLGKGDEPCGDWQFWLLGFGWGLGGVRGRVPLPTTTRSLLIILFYTFA